MRLLSFTLNEIQLREVKGALAKLEAGPRPRVIWFGDHSLDGNVLSIHALDLLTVFDHCTLESSNEMELFRPRRSAILQVQNRISKARNEIKKQTMTSWLGWYEKLSFGGFANIDLYGTNPAGKIALEDFI